MLCRMVYLYIYIYIYIYIYSGSLSAEQCTLLDIRISADASRRMYYFLLTIIIIMNEISVYIYIIRYNQLMYNKKTEKTF